jgi:type IX secretion system PorP/SprF family membrane protein
MINEDQFIIPGIYIGAKQMSISRESLTESELADQALYSNKFDKLLLTSGVGLRYKFKDLTLDFAIPKLYSADEKKIAQTFLGFAAYDFFTKDDKWRIQPGVLYRYTQTQNHLVDISFLLEYNKMLWTQVGYRTNKDVNLMLGFNLKGIGVAYNYTITNSALESFSNGNHEIALLYRLNFSFVN